MRISRNVVAAARFGRNVQRVVFNMLFKSPALRPYAIKKGLLIQLFHCKTRNRSRRFRLFAPINVKKPKTKQTPFSHSPILSLQPPRERAHRSLNTLFISAITLNNSVNDTAQLPRKNCTAGEERSRRHNGARAHQLPPPRPNVQTPQ